MNPPPTIPKLEEALAKQATFLRSLAQRLIADDAGAQDLEQECLLAALRAAPRGQDDLRGWLACVARRLAGRTARGEQRRLRREAIAARSEIALSASPEGALRELSAAVLELPEPYRKVVLLRYFREMTHAEIAEALSIPAATARSRLKRGLDRLRERLGDQGAEWRTRLLPLALPPLAATKPAGLAAAASILGVPVMAKTTALLLFLTLAGVAFLAIWLESPTPEPGANPAARRDSHETELVLGSQSRMGTPGSQSALPASIETSPFVTPAPKAATAQAQPGHAAVRGRVLDESGFPVANALIQLHCSGAKGGIHRASGDRELRSAEDGSFLIEDLQPRGSARILVRPDSLCDLTRRLTIEGAKLHDLGDLVAASGGGIEGRVLGPEGVPVPGAKVEATPVAVAQATTATLIGGWSDIPPRSCLSGEDGGFRLRGLHSGAWSLRVSAANLARGERSGLIVHAPQVKRGVDLRLESGLTLAGHIRDSDGNPLQGVHLTLAKSMIEISSGSIEPPRSLKGRSALDGSFLFSGLDDGEYELIAARRGFLTRRNPDLRPGPDAVAIQLLRSPRIIGRITGEGSPLNRPFRIHIRPPGTKFSGTKIATGSAAAKALGIEAEPGLFTVIDLSRPEFSLRVEAEGFEERVFGPFLVEGSSERELDLDLKRAMKIAGRVLGPGGLPLAGAQVLARPAPESRRGLQEARATTAEDGSFQIGGIGRGSWQIVASHENFAPSLPLPLQLGDGAPTETIEVRLREAGRIVGVVLDSRGEPWRGARVEAQRIGGNDNAQRTLSKRDGSFEILGLLPGSYRVSLVLGEDARVSVRFQPEKPKETPYRQTVRLLPKQTRSVTLREPLRQDLEGIVLESGRPAPKVRVSLVAKGAGDWDLSAPTMETGDDGRFHFSKVIQGEWVLKLRPRGSALSIRRELLVSEVGVPDLEIQLPTASLPGRVVDAITHKAVPGVRVLLARAGAKAEPETRSVVVISVSDDLSGEETTTSSYTSSGPEAIVTDEQGRFLIHYLEAGSYDLKIRGGRYRELRKKSVEIRKGLRHRPLRLQLQLGATLIVKPLGTEKEPAGLLYRVWKRGGDPDQGETQFVSGSEPAHFSGLDPGPLSVRIENLQGESQGQGEIELHAGELRTLAIPLQEK